MNKSGQFYLVTAVVIAGIIIGISSISNYSKKEKNPGIDELGEEIKIESSKTMDYATNNKLSSLEKYQLMELFTDYYVTHEARDEKDLYFIFGDDTNITVSGYQETALTVVVSSGSSQATITQVPGNFSGGINPSGSTITLAIGSNPYTFDLSPSDNFYYVITQNSQGGQYITTG